MMLYPITFLSVITASTVLDNSKTVKKTSTSLEATDVHHPLPESRNYQLSAEERLHDHLVDQRLDGVAHAIHEFEKYSQKHGLGLTVGEQKGGILESLIEEVLKTLDLHEPMNVLEMGSHIGDGSLRILNKIKSRPNSNLVAIEPDHHWHTIGPKIVRYAVRSDPSVPNSIYHPFSYPHDLFDFADTLAQNHGIKKIHVVFMDQGDHTSFKDDIEALIKAGSLAPGAKIITDNAHTKKTEKSDYFKFVDESGHFTSSETHPITHPYKDAIHVATFKKTRDEL